MTVKLRSRRSGNNGSPPIPGWPGCPAFGPVVRVDRRCLRFLGGPVAPKCVAVDEEGVGGAGFVNAASTSTKQFLIPIYFIYQSFVGELRAQGTDHVHLSIQHYKRIDLSMAGCKRQTGTRWSFLPQAIHYVDQPASTVAFASYAWDQTEGSLQGQECASHLIDSVVVAVLQQTTEVSE